jgi:hypothetical protein
MSSLNHLFSIHFVLPFSPFFIYLFCLLVCLPLCSAILYGAAGISVVLWLSQWVWLWRRGRLVVPDYVNQSRFSLALSRAYCAVGWLFSVPPINLLDTARVIKKKEEKD